MEIIKYILPIILILIEAAILLELKSFLKKRENEAVENIARGILIRSSAAVLAPIIFVVLYFVIYSI